MDVALAAALDRINRRFYDASAHDFDATRQAPWPGFREVCERLRSAGHAPVTLLDLGCGNGRFVSFLASRLEVGTAVGIDSSRALLERARSTTVRATRALWLVSDIGRELPLREDLRFHCVALLGVMHHVPTFERRRGLLERALARVSRGGLLAVTFWQLAGEESIASRTLAPDAVDEILGAEIGSTRVPHTLDRNDFLVTFGAKRAPRYVHECDAEERMHLLAGLPVHVVAEFESDGRKGRGNVYVLLRPTV